MSAETVLLLHGQPGRARDWDPLLAAIGRRASAIAFDRPGWDGSRATADLAGNAAAALGALNRARAESATVVGHSLGGAVAAWLAAAHPDRVGSLVLLAPAANQASLYTVDRWLAAPLIGDVATVAALASVGVALGVAPARRRIARAMALDERYLRSAGRMLVAPRSWRAFVAEQRALIRDLPSLERMLAEITAPTRIVVGSDDRVVPMSSARQLVTQIRGAELVVLEGAGHLLAQQQPEQLADVILG